MITVITAWYNEEFFAPLFLSHYRFADRIVVLLDESTNDGTLDVINSFKENNAFPVVEVRKLMMPFGLDDKLKQKQLKAAYKSVEEGWVILVDIDEFLQIPKGGLKEYLGQVEADVVKVDYIQMYQHESENSLNRIDPIFEQRKYGKRNGLARWKKPAIARAGCNIAWSVGHHEVNVDSNICDKMILGAHLNMADVDLAIFRRINNHKIRQSPANYKSGLSAHNWNITEGKIRAICEENKNCEKIF